MILLVFDITINDRSENQTQYYDENENQTLYCDGNKTIKKRPSEILKDIKTFIDDQTFSLL